MSWLDKRLKQFQKPEMKTAFNQGPFWSNTSVLDGMAPGVERLGNDFNGYVEEVYKDNGVVFACILTRMMVFSEARFQWQKMEGGRPTTLFDDENLRILDYPWIGGFTGGMLKQWESDASLAGNSYWTTCDDFGNYGKAARGKDSTRLVRMPPDRVDIILWAPSGWPGSLNTRIAGYRFKAGIGAGNGQQPPGGQGAGDVLLLADEVAHYAPIPDPQARYRGMSWITPILRDIAADNAAVDHKKNFFSNGATLGHVVTFKEETSQEDFDEFVAKFKAEHHGFENAYKTLFLGGGADVTAIGTDLRQLEFSQTQGHGETKIAAASGVPPIIVGLSEGLQAATYSNYGQARRRFADGTLRPLWRMAAGAAQMLVDPPDKNCRLWYDDRDIAFLREDKKDTAEIVSLNVQSARALVEAGWKPDDAILAIDGEDLSVLIGAHTGKLSVQLQDPEAQMQLERDKLAAEAKAKPEPAAPAKPPAGGAVPKVPGSKDAGWSEDKHPRDPNGKFGDGILDEVTAPLTGASTYKTMPGYHVSGTPAEKNAQDDSVHAYRSEAYKPINQFLRHGDGKYNVATYQPDPADDKDLNKDFSLGLGVTVGSVIENLDKLFANEDNLTKADLLTFRGIGMDALGEDLKVGSLMHDKGYTSTTMSKGTATGFLKRRADFDKLYGRPATEVAIINVHIPKGSRAMKVDSDRYGPGVGVKEEYEVLVDRGSALRVTKIKKLPSGKTVIDATLEQP